MQRLQGHFWEWVKGKVSDAMRQQQQRHAVSLDNRAEDVHTEMIVTEYFEGELAEAKSHDYKPDPHSTRREELPSGWKIPAYSFFMEHEGRTPSSVCLVGEAGSGKTTAMQRYIAERPNVFHFVLCSPLTRQSYWTKSTIFDFLFPDKSGCSVDILREGFEWMLKNPRSIIFHLDALDTLPFVSDLNRNHVVSDGTPDMEDYYTPKEIIGGIMAGCFFRGCRLVLSSRHSAVTKLPEQFRPKRMISLIGLTDDSIKKYSELNLGDSDGKTFCKRIKMEHPNLWLVLAVPLFLVFSLTSYQALRRLPSSMSDVLVNLLRSQVSSSGMNFSRVIAKIKKLSYDGILANKVTFNEEDLYSAGLSAAEATSISIFVPWKESNLPGTESMRNLLFFSHQCIQEIFCALYVIELAYGDFVEFMKKHFRNRRLSIVRQFIVGILLNERVLESAKHGNLISDLPDLANKKEVLLKFLKEELTRDKDPQETLDLFVTAGEAGMGAKNAIEEGLKSIDISGIASICRPSDMHAMGSTIKFCNSLAELDISNCDLNPAKMEAFYCGLTSPPRRDGKVKIRKIRLKRSTKLGESGMMFLAKCLQVLEPKKIALDRCKISAQQLVALNKVLGENNLKIRKLHLKEIFDAGVEVTDDTLQAICQLLPHLEEYINIRGWRLNDEQLTTIKRELENNKRIVVKYGDKNESKALNACTI